jgi:hypothetical protein
MHCRLQSTQHDGYTNLRRLGRSQHLYECGIVPHVRVRNPVIWLQRVHIRHNYPAQLQCGLGRHDIVKLRCISAESAVARVADEHDGPDIDK